MMRRSANGPSKSRPGAARRVRAWPPPVLAIGVFLAALVLAGVLIGTDAVRGGAGDATGHPRIQGAPHVGLTWQVNPGNLADPDGLPDWPGDYDIQWIRVDADGTNEVDIPGATSVNYRNTEDDLGKRLKVEISFTDNGGNAEQVTSELHPTNGYPEAVIQPRRGSCDDRFANGAEFCTTMIVGYHTYSGGANGYGVDNDALTPYGSLSTESLSYNSARYDIYTLTLVEDDGGDYLYAGFNTLLPREVTLNVGGTIFTFDAKSERRNLDAYIWDIPDGFSLVENQRAIVSIDFPPTRLTIDDATATVSDHMIKFNVRLSKAFTETVRFKFKVTEGNARGDWAHHFPNQAHHFIYAGTTQQQIYIPLKGGLTVGNTVTVRITEANYDSYSGGVLKRNQPIPIDDATARGTIGAAPTTSNVSGYSIGISGTSAREPYNGYVTALFFSPHLTPHARHLDEFVCYKYETLDSDSATTATPGDEVVRFGRFEKNPNNADYRKTTGRGAFWPIGGTGSSSWDSFSVIIFDDTVNDNNEKVKVKLSEAHVCGDASRTIHIAGSTTIGTIYNTDPIPARSFSVSDAEATEGVDASLDFTVIMGKAQDEAVTVDYATSDGTATAGSDYTAQHGTLKFAPGETTRIISVPIANDSEDDDRETVELTLSNPSSGGAIHHGEAVGRINDYLRREVWYSNMTAGEVYNEFGYINVGDEKRGSLKPKSFVVDGETVTVKLIEAGDWIYIGFDQELPVGFTLTVDDVELESSDAAHTSYSYAEVYRWNAQDIYWDEGEDVGLALSRKDLPTTAEAEAVGPAITGAAQVGSTLTAHTASIFDEHGLEDASFEYQWIRNDGADDSDIADATSSTYTLTEDDEDRTIKVKVTFTDDEDNDEERTSAATAVVAAKPNSAATGAPTISGSPVVGQTLTADTSGIADADGLDDVTYSYQWIANDGTADSEIDGATGSSFFVLAAYEDQTLKLRVSFTDDDGNDESLTSAATEAVTLSAQAQQSNNEATGAPTISGTAQVGQSLTAATSGISDDDGLDNVSYSYQWIRNDGTDDSDISGATSSTYILTKDDQGKTVKVQVTFIDDEGNDESLTSAATGTVAARANSSATGAPTITGTAQVGETLTVNTSGIADDDGLDDVTYSYQWIRNDGTDDSDISGATSSTYTLTDDDEGETIKVKVSFSDDEDNDESLTSAATGTVAAAPLTADFLSVPSSHDGESVFSLRVSFSEELQNGSSRKIRRALSASGGTVKSVRRVDKARDLFVIRVKPSGTGDVTISLDAFSGACADDDAVCDRDGRKLAERIEETVSGPGEQPGGQLTRQRSCNACCSRMVKAVREQQAIHAPRAEHTDNHTVDTDICIGS